MKHTLLAMAICIGSAGHAIAGAAAVRPNIVVIMADDMGYECVGANGSTTYKTPHLDRLAAAGMRFEFAFAQPLCTPSRVQLMTGLYNQRNYIRFGLLDPRATTFAQLLRQAGYATCIVGKWQLGGGFDAPGHFGFDEYCLWQLGIRKSRYPNPVIERNGKVLEYTNGEYGPDIVSDYLCDFMERHKDRPFLAYYPMILPHSPFVPTPDSASYNPKARDEAAGADKKYFADMVAFTDKMVGKVIAKLDALNLRDKTLVLFTCDNGTGKGLISKMGDRVVIGGKGMTTDAGTHVPLIASWPGKIAAGKVQRDLIDFTDFMPTLLDVAAVKSPRGISLDGRSFLPQLLGEKGEPRTWIYSWYARDGGPKGAESARNHEYRLYADGRLFQVANDPLEQSPLDAKDAPPAARQARMELQAALDRFRGTRQIKRGKP